MLSSIVARAALVAVVLPTLTSSAFAINEVYIETSKNAWIRSQEDGRYLGLKDKYSDRVYTGRFRKQSILPVTCHGVSSEEPALKLDIAHLTANKTDFSILQGEDFTIGGWFFVSPDEHGQSILMSQRGADLSHPMFSNQSSWIFWTPQNGPGAGINFFFLRQTTDNVVDLYQNPNVYLQSNAAAQKSQQQRRPVRPVPTPAPIIPIQTGGGDGTQYVIKDHLVETGLNGGYDLTGPHAGIFWGDSLSDCWVGGQHRQCWHHIAISYKAQAPSPQLFMIVSRLQMNGKTESAYYPLNANTLMSSRSIQVGRTWVRIGEFTSALMKDLFIVKHAMDIKEILQQMQTTKPGKQLQCEYDKFQETRF